MKRILYIFFMFLFLGNLSAIIHTFKTYGVPDDFMFLLKAHYEVSIYALKFGVIGVIADWLTKDLFIKDKNK